MSANELENYKLQLQQVEAALMAEPNNEELQKLKEDLVEIIELQEELVGAGAAVTSTSALRGQGGGLISDSSKWKVGDRCMAPTKNGQKYVAVIDGISQDRAAISFTGNGVKDMVRLSDLSTAPVEEKKNYIFQNAKSGGGGPKKEWQLERERRKLRAQKKEQRKKAIDEAKEQEKSKWKNFTAKASHKHLKGLKRVEATSSAADGGKEAPERRAAISSRKDHSLGRTSRGNMDSLF